MNGTVTYRYEILVRGAANTWVVSDYATTLSECLGKVEEALLNYESVQVEVVRPFVANDGPYTVTKVA